MKYNNLVRVSTLTATMCLMAVLPANSLTVSYAAVHMTAFSDVDDLITEKYMHYNDDNGNPQSSNDEVTRESVGTYSGLSYASVYNWHTTLQPTTDPTITIKAHGKGNSSDNAWSKISLEGTGGSNPVVSQNHGGPKYSDPKSVCFSVLDLEPGETCIKQGTFYCTLNSD